MEDKEKIKQELAAAELYKAMTNQSQQADPRTLDNQCCDKCKRDKCKHDIFEKKYIIKKVIQNGQEFDAPMPVFVCAKCGTIIKSMREDLCIDEYANKPITKATTLII